MQKLDGGGCVFPQVEDCVYCGASGALTKEHIVPLGLFGNLILPRGSCTSCATLTSKFELSVLRRLLGIHRRSTKFQSRNKSKKPRHKGLKAVAENIDSSSSILHLEESELPSMTMSLPLYDYPLREVPASISTPRINDKMWFISSKHDAEAALAKGGGNRPMRYTLGTYDKQTFCRFLAKIAHSYAAAVLGLENFDPFLKDFVLEGTGPSEMFVGGLPGREPPELDMYKIMLDTKQTAGSEILVFVYIRLLSYAGAPTYRIIVGSNPRCDIGPLEHRRHARPIVLRAEEG